MEQSSPSAKPEQPSTARAGRRAASENLTITYNERVYKEQADRDRWVNGSFTVEHFGT